jgi:hypothetical protein
VKEHRVSPRRQYRGAIRMLTEDEFFGAPDRIAPSKRSANLWSILRDNPRHADYGRLVALSDPGQDTADVLSAMAIVRMCAGFRTLVTAVKSTGAE